MIWILSLFVTVIILYRVLFNFSEVKAWYNNEWIYDTDKFEKQITFWGRPRKWRIKKGYFTNSP